MARKRRTIIEDEIPDSRPGAFDMENDPEPIQISAPIIDPEAESTLTKLLEGIGSSAVIKIKVSKKTPKGPAFCFTHEGIDINEDEIRECWGSGSYVLRVHVNGEYRTTAHLQIADRLTPLSSSAPGSSIADMQIKMMNDQLSFFKDLLLQQMSGANKQQTPIGELTSAMVSVNEMSSKRNDPASGMKEMLETFMLMKEVFGGDKSSGDWKADLLGIVKDVAKPIVSAMASGAIPGQQNPSQAALPAGSEQPVGATDMRMSMNVIRSAITELKKQAINQTDPALVTDWIVSNAADYEPILAFISNSSFETFVEIDPEIGNPLYANFFKSVYDGLRRAISGQDSMDGDTGESGGNAPNVAENDGTGVLVRGKANGSGVLDTKSN
jgi:hypothetical protein